MLKWVFLILQAMFVVYCALDKVYSLQWWAFSLVFLGIGTIHYRLDEIQKRLK